MCVGAFLLGGTASSASQLKASLCRNGLGWGLGCKHNCTGHEAAAASVMEQVYCSHGYTGSQRRAKSSCNMI